MIEPKAVVERDDDGQVSKVIFEFPPVHSWLDDDVAAATKAFVMCLCADEILREKERERAAGQPRTRPLPPKRAGAQASYDHESATAPLSLKDFGK